MSAFTGFLSATSSWGLRIFLLLAGVLAALYAVAFVILQRDPDALIEKYLAEISREIGLKFEIGSIDVTLLPLPAIALSNIVVEGKDLHLRTAWAEARPDLRLILAGASLPGEITILRPRLKWKTELDFSDLSQLKKQLEPLLSDKKNSHAKPGGAIRIIGMEAVIEDASGSSINFNNLELRARLLPDGSLDADLRAPIIRMIDKGAHLGELNNVSATADCNIGDLSGKPRSFQIKASAKLPNVIAHASCGLQFGGSGPEWTGALNTEGDLDLSGFHMPFRISGNGDFLSGSNRLSLADIAWQLGPDSGAISAVLQFEPWSIEGKLAAHRLSLTEWFGFARNLCPGLQQSLDNITNASMDFHIDAKGIAATNIEASCAGSTYKGSGGVESWAEPLVALKLYTPEANLGLGLPESVGDTPDAPWYGHPPLTPMPGAPLKPGEKGIDYDIRLGAHNVIYGAVQMQSALVRIYPGKMDVSGLQDVLVDGNAKFYGGTFTGSCILGADPSLPIHISCKARNINARGLGKAMTMQPLRDGIFEATASIDTRGKTLKPFLTNLRGTIATKGQKAVLEGVKTTFSRISANLGLRTASWNGTSLGLDGKWKVSATAPQIEATAETNGKLDFGQNGMTFQKLPSTISCKIGQGFPLPAGSHIKLSGKLGVQSDKKRIEITGGVLELPGFTIKGNAQIDAGNENAQGSFSTQTDDLPSALARLGIGKVPLPADLRNFKITADFSASTSGARLSKMDASLGKLSATGNVGWKQQNGHPSFDVDLALGRIKVADYISNSGKNGANWNFPFMKAFDASGKIGLKSLDVYGLNFTSPAISFRLNNGVLNIESIHSGFYDSTVAGKLTADFRKGLAFDTTMAAKDFNLGAAVKDQKLDALISGIASANFKLSGKLSGAAKMASALNGIWGLHVRNGSWQNVTKAGAPSGKPTEFNQVNATGAVIDGLVKTSNFSLSGPGLSVKGIGSLNLADKKLDCNFDISMKGLPDFPLKLYGNLDKPQTSIGVGKLALNAVGDIASGFGKAVGSVFKGMWSIFAK